MGENNGGNLHELHTLPYLMRRYYVDSIAVSLPVTAIKMSAFTFLKEFAHKLELNQQITPGMYNNLCKCSMTVDDKGLEKP